MAIALFVLGLCMIAVVASAIIFFVCYAVTSDDLYGGLCFASMFDLSVIAIVVAILTIINLAQTV